MDVRLTPAGLPSAPAGVSSPMLVGARVQGESSCPGEMPGKCVSTFSTKIKESFVFDQTRIRRIFDTSMQGRTFTISDRAVADNRRCR